MAQLYTELCRMSKVDEPPKDYEFYATALYMNHYLVPEGTEYYHITI
jgi:hypothetical protein